MSGCIISEKYTLSGSIYTVLGTEGNMGKTEVKYPTGVVIVYGTFFEPYPEDKEEPDVQGVYVNPGVPPSDMVNMLKTPYAAATEESISVAQAMYYKSKKQLEKFLGVDFYKRTSQVASHRPRVIPHYYGVKKFVEDYGVDTGYGLFGRGQVIADTEQFSTEVVSGTAYNVGTTKIYKTEKFLIDSESKRGGVIISKNPSGISSAEKTTFETTRNGYGEIYQMGYHNVQSGILENVKITAPFSLFRAGLLGTTRSASPRISQTLSSTTLEEFTSTIYSYTQESIKGYHFLTLSAVYKIKIQPFIVIQTGGFEFSIGSIHLPYLGFPTSIPIIGSLLNRRNCCNFGANNVKLVSPEEGFPSGTTFVKIGDVATKNRIAWMLEFPTSITNIVARKEERIYFPIDDEYGVANVGGIVKVYKINKFGEYDEDVSTFHTSGGKSNLIPIYHPKKMVYTRMKKSGLVYKELSMNIGNIYFYSEAGLSILLNKLTAISTAKRRRVSGDIRNFKALTGNAISLSFDYINGTYSAVYVEFDELPINPFG